MATLHHDRLRALLNEAIDNITHKDSSLSLFVEPKKAAGYVTVLQLYADRGAAPICIGGVGFAPLYEQRVKTATVLRYTKEVLLSALQHTPAGYTSIAAFDLHNNSWKMTSCIWHSRTLVDSTLSREGLASEEAVKEELVKMLEDNVHAFIPCVTAARSVSSYGAWTAQGNRQYRVVYYSDSTYDFEYA